MPTFTKTIGTTGDFTSIQSWINALPADLTTGGTAGSYVGQLQNQAFSGAVTIDFSGHVTNSTHTITLQCVTGASFRDNAGAATNPLRPLSTNGALVTCTGYGIAALTLGSAGNLILQGLQIDATGGLSPGISGVPTNVTVDSCLIRSTSTVAQFDGSSSTAKNSVFVNAGAGGNGLSVSSGSSILDCTVVRPAGVTAAGTGVLSSYGNAVLKGTAIFGFTNPTGLGTGGGFAAGSSGNATNSGSAWTTNVTGLQSVPFTNSTFANAGSTAANVDLRLVTGSTLIDAGVTVSGIGVDVIGTTRPQGSVCDVGAFEFPAASGSVGSASGLATATGVGASQAASVGSASALATATATGLTGVPGAGSAAGLATASATGSSLTASVASASGGATATAQAGATGSASGLATATAVGAALTASVGTASASATATATGSAQSASVGSASGLATAAATGAPLARGVGSAAASSTATAVGATSSAGQGTGSASGLASASGASASRAASAGTSSGLATASAAGLALVRAVGAASGLATATATGAALAASVGSATGSSTATGMAPGTGPTSSPYYFQRFILARKAG